MTNFSFISFARRMAISEWHVGRLLPAPFTVMAGLVPAIHTPCARHFREREWIAGTSPAMTKLCSESLFVTRHSHFALHTGGISQ